MNYYNEHDLKAAAWLRELIKQGHIPDGVVDESDIQNIKPESLKNYVQCHFFAGIGGWSHALKLSGWPADRPVWTGSCPCQPFSSAGKGKGHSDERHLWPVFFQLIKECRPVTVFGEQVASAIGHGWLDGISADLEGEGYACGAVVLGAHSVGAPHIRQRLYWVADAFSARLEKRQKPKARQGDLRERRKGWEAAGQDLPQTPWSRAIRDAGRCGNTRRVQPGICPLAHGISGRVGLLRGYGNAICPQTAQAFIESYLT